MVERGQREDLLAGLLIHLAAHLEVLAIPQVVSGPLATFKTHSYSSSELRSWLIGC